MSEKIIIKADPDTADLIPGYLENRKKDLQNLSDALSGENFDLVQTLSHRMKGSGTGYGFAGITAIGGAMEEAAKLRNAADIRKGIADLADYLERVEVVYDQP